MKKVSKLLSILLCLAMVIGIFTMAVGAAGTTYTKIDRVEDLTAGTYYMGGYLTTYTNQGTTYDWTANPYHMFNDVSTDLFTTPYSFTNGVLTKKAGEQYDANTVELVAVSGKADTYYVKIDNKYLYSSEYNNRKLGLTTTATEWVASNSSKGGISLTTSVGTGTVTLGTAGATSKMLRSYKDSASSLKYGLVFFKEGTSAPSNDPTITLDKSSLVLAKDATATLAATTTNVTNPTIEWSTSAASVATVNNGTVTAVAPGEATITAKISGTNVSTTCSVWVKPAAAAISAANAAADNSFHTVVGEITMIDGQSIYIQDSTGGICVRVPSNSGMAIGGTLTASGKRSTYNGLIQLDATNATQGAVSYAAGTASVTPADVTSSGIANANLSKLLKVTGTFTVTEVFDNNGGYNTPNITVKDANNNSFVIYKAPLTKVSGEWPIAVGDTITSVTGVLTVNIKNNVTTYRMNCKAADDIDTTVFVTGVTLDKTSQNLTVGGTVDLVATVAPSNATNQDVTWTSSNTAVATVANGKVTAVAPGTATITVTTADGSKTATCTITVVAATVPATGVTLDKTTASLEVGKDVTLSATVAPADSTDAVVWSTSDATIATVAGGKVTALKAGTVTITAKAGDKTATCTVTVTAPVVEEEDNTTGGANTGNTDSGNSGSTTPSTPVKPSAPVWTVQDAPKTGVSFKYGLNQKGLEKQLWFTGAMDGYYLAMSEDIKDAVDVVVETVEGGYRLAFTKEGVKKYIDIVERTDKAGSANVVITDEPTAVLTWDATAKTFFAKIGENTFYLGTYNTFKTISASNISYITGDNASKVDVSQYVSHLYLDTASSTGDAFEPMVIVLALAAVSALAVLALNKKKFSF